MIAVSDAFSGIEDQGDTLTLTHIQVTFRWDKSDIRHSLGVELELDLLLSIVLDREKNPMFLIDDTVTHFQSIF